MLIQYHYKSFLQCLIIINNVKLLPNKEIKDKKGMIAISTFLSSYIPEFVDILCSYHLLILSSLCEICIVNNYKRNRNFIDILEEKEMSICRGPGSVFGIVDKAKILRGNEGTCYKYVLHIQHVSKFKNRI